MVEADTSMRANLQLSDAIRLLEERLATLPLARRAGLNAARHARAQSSVNFIVGCLSHINGGSGSCRSLLALKSVWQHYAPTQDVLGLLECSGGWSTSPYG